jgi:hypothetical protein
MKPGETREHRRKDRGQLIGDVLWSYATNPAMPQFEGTLIDMSKTGLGMFSEKPVKEASILRINAKGLWQGAKYATVMWCEEVEPSLYRSGLLFNETP